MPAPQVSSKKGQALSEERRSELERSFVEADVNNDGGVDLYEFVALYEKVSIPAGTKAWDAAERPEEKKVSVAAAAGLAPSLSPLGSMDGQALMKKGQSLKVSASFVEQPPGLSMVDSRAAAAKTAAAASSSAFNADNADGLGSELAVAVESTNVLHHQVRGEGFPQGVNTAWVGSSVLEQSRQANTWRQQTSTIDAHERASGRPSRRRRKTREIPLE
jgi:hypothetical protein